MRVRPGSRWLTAAAGALLVTALAACSSSSGSSSQGSGASFKSQTIAQLQKQANTEGQVNWYTTFADTDVKPMVAAFNKQFPKIKINALRLSADQLPPRVITEQKGHKYNADVVSGDSPQVAQLVNAGALQPYTPPDEAPVPTGLTMQKGYTAVIYVVTTVIAWNPTALKQAGLTAPTSWQDLTKPQWKGKFSIDPGAVNWYDALIQQMGHAKALALIQALGKNKPKLVTSHTEAITQVEAGEPIASATTYGYKSSSESKKNPSQITFVNTDPLPASLTLIDLAKNPPHPAAAELFEDWMMSQAGQQEVVNQTNHTSLRSDVTNDPKVWNTSTWPAVWGTPLMTNTTYNSEVKEMDQAFGVNS